MKLKRLVVTIKKGGAQIVAYGHAARGQEKVIGVVEAPLEELDTTLNLPAVQELLYMTRKLD